LLFTYVKNYSGSPTDCCRITVEIYELANSKLRTDGHQQARRLDRRTDE
jgi:hypothetical protein